jgi:hypothetical protein
MRHYRPGYELGRALINPPCGTGAEMSAFGGKADIKRYCEESPLLTQSGHAARARSSFDKEACVGCTGRSTASLGGNKRLAALALFIAS